jgi:predicted secreted protein
MRKIIEVLIVLFALATLPINGAPASGSGGLNRPWARAYGGVGYDLAVSVNQMPNGGLAIVGITNSFGVGGYHVWVLRLNGVGGVVWQKSYGGAGDDYARSAVLTSDGGLVVVSDSSSFGAPPYSTWIMRLNRDGSIAWQNIYGGPSISTNSISQTSDGGFIVGRGLQPPFGSQLIKLNADGSVAWARTYGEISIGFRSVSGPIFTQQTSDGGFMLASTVASAMGSDMLLLKLDAVGNIVWEKQYGGIGDNFASSAEQTSDGGFILAGTTGSLSAGLFNAWLLKVNATGSVEWQKEYGPIGLSNPGDFSIRPTSDKGFVLAGTAGSDFFGLGLLVRLDPLGNIEWQRTYGSPAAFLSVEQTSDNGFVVAGSRRDVVSGADAWILKVNSNGEMHPCTDVVWFNGRVTDTNAVTSRPITTVTGSLALVTPTSATITPTSGNTNVLCPSHDLIALDRTGGFVALARPRVS